MYTAYDMRKWSISVSGTTLESALKTLRLKLSKPETQALQNIPGDTEKSILFWVMKLYECWKEHFEVMSIA